SDVGNPLSIVRKPDVHDWDPCEERLGLSGCCVVPYQLTQTGTADRIELFPVAAGHTPSHEGGAIGQLRRLRVAPAEKSALFFKGKKVEGVWYALRHEDEIPS